MRPIFKRNGGRNEKYAADAGILFKSVEEPKGKLESFAPGRAHRVLGADCVNT